MRVVRIVIVLIMIVLVIGGRRRPREPFRRRAALFGRRTIKKIDKPERTLESLRELPDVMHREAPGARHRDVPTVVNGQAELRGDNYVV